MKIETFNASLSLLMVLNPLAVYFVIVGVLILCGFGLPIPEDIMLITGGYLAYEGVVNVNVMFLFGLIGVLGGDIIMYFLGAKFGNKILKSKFFSRIISDSKIEKARHYVHKYGNRIFFIARFLPGLRAPIFFTAGSLHIRFRLFIIFDGAAALISVPIWIYSAWHWGEYIFQIIMILKKLEYYILTYVISLAIFFILTKVIRWWIKHKKQAA